MTLSHIQAEVLRRAGRETVGDYSYFAARAESLFMNSGLYALDEYGIPPETARRLAPRDVAPMSLDQALALVGGVDIGPSTKLHPFECEIIADVKATLPARLLI